MLKWPHSDWYCFIQATNIAPWIPHNCVWFLYNWTILVSIWDMNFLVIANWMAFFPHSSAKRNKNQLPWLLSGISLHRNCLGLRSNLWMARKNRKCVLNSYQVRQVKTGVDQPADACNNSASLYKMLTSQNRQKCGIHALYVWHIISMLWKMRTIIFLIQ